MRAGGDPGGSRKGKPKLIWGWVVGEERKAWNGKWPRECIRRLRDFLSVQRTSAACVAALISELKSASGQLNEQAPGLAQADRLAILMLRHWKLHDDCALRP